MVSSHSSAYVFDSLISFGTTVDPVFQRTICTGLRLIMLLYLQVISIFTFAAQCLGCCPSQHQHVHAPANWELRQYGTFHFPVPPGGAPPCVLFLSALLSGIVALYWDFIHWCAFSAAGPAIIQISGMQQVPPPAQGRSGRRRPKVQPLSAELLNRLPSFYLASTAKARMSYLFCCW